MADALFPLDMVSVLQVKDAAAVVIARAVSTLQCRWPCGNSRAPDESREERMRDVQKTAAGVDAQRVGASKACHLGWSPGVLTWASCRVCSREKDSNASMERIRDLDKDRRLLSRIS